jgi:predicted nucleic acid-binding protein
MIVVADTGAVIALVDADDEHHQTLSRLYEQRPDAFVLPWAILPEVDYLLSSRLGSSVARAFLDDLATERFSVEWGSSGDLARARDLNARYRTLRLGLVDGVVIAVAERLRADAIATLDLRHFGAVAIAGQPKLLPRDLETVPPRKRKRR